MSGAARARARVRGGVAVSGADDLRTPIDGVDAGLYLALAAAAEDGSFGDVLRDPVCRLAILNLIGDVTEGYGQEDEEGNWQIGRVEALHDDGDQHVFVVRPRGEGRSSFDPAYNAAGVEPPPDRPRGEATDA